MWKEETILEKAMGEGRQTCVNSNGELLIDTEYEPLVPKEEKTAMQIMRDNLNIKRILVLLVVWICFLLLQVLKNELRACSPLYWVLNLLQFPATLAVFLYECIKLYKESKKRRLDGSGGGFILGPLLLEIGVIPQVASATATFVMMFSSSLSVVEFYLLKRFPIPYALYLMCVSILAGFWGQFFVRKLITILRRASLIVFILSGVIFASALTMGVVGTEKSIRMIKNHEFMGFLDFCSSQ
ncbi:Sulfite exporter TauE/SafE family protein [Abeliophyllum distichum]|uniref:Sulfite exporter TauE/SafE family protein n=1 Tax=Abeliophyllum distichum TaxID=126358 RepID=A0ABD1QYN1_9LAMI